MSVIRKHKLFQKLFCEIVTLFFELGTCKRKGSDGMLKGGPAEGDVTVKDCQVSERS